MANQATAGNSTNHAAAFSFVSGPFGPTPHLPPFTSMAPPPTGVLLMESLAQPLTTPPGGGGGPTNVLTPDNARDNSQARSAHPGNHPLTFNGG